MRNMKRIWLMLTVLLLMITCLVPTATIGAAEMQNSTSSQQLNLEKVELMLTSVEKDGVLTVTVSGKQLKDVYAYELLFHYDPLRLELTEASVEVSGFTIEPMRKGNQLVLAHTKVGSVPGITGEAKLAVLTFKRIRGGDTFVALKEARLVASSLAFSEAKPDVSVASKDGREDIKLTDIAQHWAEERIRIAVELGFVTGYSDGTFRPNASVTRLQFATLLARALLLKESSQPRFTDSEQIPEWASGAVNAAVGAGLIKGYADGTFRGEQPINRAEMAVMIVRALGVQSAGGSELSFSDTASIPGWAQSSVRLAVEQGLLRGKGGNQFAPLVQATRAEAISVILDLLYKRTDITRI